MILQRVQTSLFLLILLTIVTFELNDEEISEKLRLIESKLQDQEYHYYQIEIRKIQNEINRLTEHIKLLDERYEELNDKKNFLESGYNQQKMELINLFEKYTVIQEFIQSEFEMYQARYEEELARESLTSSYYYGAAAYADAHNDYLGQQNRYNKAHVRYSNARSKLYELKISEKENNLYESGLYLENIFNNMRLEMQDKKDKIKIIMKQMESLLNEVKIKKIDLKFKKLDRLAFYELN
jgi:hypothetical protein